jgi:hypothetical protein
MNTGSQQVTASVNKGRHNSTCPCHLRCLWSQLAGSVPRSAGIHFPEWFSCSPWGYLCSSPLQSVCKTPCVCVCVCVCVWDSSPERQGRPGLICSPILAPWSKQSGTGWFGCRRDDAKNPAVNRLVCISALSLSHGFNCYLAGKDSIRYESASPFLHLSFLLSYLTEKSSALGLLNETIAGPGVQWVPQQ